VLEGDTRIVHDEIEALAWIARFDAEYHSDQSIWTIVLQVATVTPTDLLRVVLADRRLQVIEFSLVELEAGDSSER
jgi:hypothetical protein